MSQDQLRMGKLLFKKQGKFNSSQAKKMTNHLNINLLSKRKFQDMENNQIVDIQDSSKKDQYQEKEQHDEEQERAIKDKEEILNPETIIKKTKIGKTPAQVSYDMIKMKRIEERIEKVYPIPQIKKQLELTYREKVDEFNRKIAKMPEHYDIPKVGPG